VVCRAGVPVSGLWVVDGRVLQAFADRTGEELGLLWLFRHECTDGRSIT
jgi:hypothetical protein